MTATLLEPAPLIATPETEAKLCYVQDNFAYFTTQELSEQWGDDWDDAPYEHNAGEPYEGEGWRIVRVGFDSGTLKEARFLASFSVAQINSGAIAWLHTPSSRRTASSFPLLSVPAGVTIPEFKNIIWRSGGEIYTLESNPCLTSSPL